MESPDTTRTVLGIVGNASSLILFLAPLLTVYKVWRSGSTRRLSWLPYITALSNCLAWVLYGIIPGVHPHSFSLITINGAGAFLECSYVVVFIFYAREKRKIVDALGLVLVFFAAAALVTLTVLRSDERTSLFVGVLAMLSCIAMYASPLSIMFAGRLCVWLDCLQGHVIVKKSVKRMSLLLSIAELVSAVVWTAYANIHFDLFLTTSNGLGILLVIFQLILYGKYYRTTNWNEEEDDEDESEGLFTNLFRQYQQVPYLR